MQLTPCTELWGDCVIYDHEPSVAVWHNVIYTPFRPDQSWGVFDEKGEIIEATVNYRGCERHTSAQVTTADFHPDHVRQHAPKEPYIYAGRINPHYGHFLIDFLSRLWPIAAGLKRPQGVLFRRLGLRGKKIRPKFVVHDSAALAFCLDLPFVQSIFSALDLTASDFVVYDERVRLAELVVPSTSFREQSFSHRAFRRLCHLVGAAAVGSRGAARDGPVYLSKTRLRLGVRRFINEPEIEEVMQRNGVDILYPEELTWPDQVRLFAQRSTVLGSVTSAFHTSIFTRPRAAIFGLSPTSGINSNFTIIDQLNENRAQYFFPSGAHLQSENQAFLNNFFVPEPRAAAEALLRAAGI